MNRDQIGTNMQIAYVEATSPTYEQLFKAIGVGLVRWPGGTTSDYYQWQSNSSSSCTPPSGYGVYAGNTFDNYMASMIQPGGFDLNLTVNYGTNANCTGGGDPAVAAGWVAYANATKHYGVKYWTVGNEQYLNCTTPSGVVCSPDLNSPSHDPATYASRVANLLYPQMKAQDPTISVGVDLAAGTGGTVPNWDSIVLANAKYDYVEMHFYAGYPPNAAVTPTFLVQQASGALATAISTAKAELASAGKPSTPIYLGEWDGESNPADTQLTSITNALFLGQAFGEITKAGVAMTTIWDGIETCLTPYPNSGAYSWQTLSNSGVFSALASSPCSSSGIPPTTTLPKARVLQLASLYIVPGEKPLATTVNASLTNAYGATQGTGFVFMLFNQDENNSHTLTVGVKNTTQTSFAATTTTYGKAQYDQSQTGVWAGPVTASLGTVTNPFSITLPPWSMTVVQLATAPGASIRKRH